MHARARCLAASTRIQAATICAWAAAICAQVATICAQVATVRIPGVRPGPERVRLLDHGDCQGGAAGRQEARQEAGGGLTQA